MRSPGRSADEQYALVMECRSSGLSDQQWLCSMISTQVLSTTGSNGFVIKPVMKYLRLPENHNSRLL